MPDVDQHACMLQPTLLVQTQSFLKPHCVGTLIENLIKLIDRFTFFSLVVEQAKSKHCPNSLKTLPEHSIVKITICSQLLFARLAFHVELRLEIILEWHCDKLVDVKLKTASSSFDQKFGSEDSLRYRSQWEFTGWNLPLLGSWMFGLCFLADHCSSCNGSH